MITPNIRAFYNDTDRYCCDWLSNLMDAGLITPGVISDKSISVLTPDEIKGYERVHFFAGIAGWDYALNLAGWTTRLVFTGSCPCQPFSAAGQGKAADDIRHLWPDWFELIRAVRPAIVFGEQVESAIGWGWLDLVYDDMGAEGYAVRAAVLPACGVGAPHIRNRLWFVAQSDGAGRRSCGAWKPHEQSSNAAGQSGATGELADADAARCGAGRTGEASDDGTARVEPAGFRDDELGDANQSRLQGWRLDTGEHAGQCVAGPTGPWSDLEWIACSDGKARPAKPGIFPLVTGLSRGMGHSSNQSSPIEANASAEGRVGRLRAYGNSINVYCAKAFIEVCYDDLSLQTKDETSYAKTR